MSRLLEGWRWRFQHAVNSRRALERFLRSNRNIAEGDVLQGRLWSHPRTPLGAIMAHPPSRRSDLSFEAWLRVLREHERAAKVDLKDAAAVGEVLELLCRYPVPADRLIVNADVVCATSGERPPLGPDDLLLFRHSLGGVVLSVGAPTNGAERRYSPKVVSALLRTAERVGPPVTVPLRADLVRTDCAVLDFFTRCGLHVTIWNNPRIAPASEVDHDYFRERVPDALIDLVDARGEPVR